MTNLGYFVYQNDYPDYSSVNIGDYIQTLAALNIYRQSINSVSKKNYTFPEFLEGVINNNIPDYNFVRIRRDNFYDIPADDNIITLMNGWWMWPCNINEDIHFDIPENVSPIFTSFHIYNDKLLEPGKLDTFRKHAPIGCRDLATLKKLKNHDIDCYFSGCLTTSINFLEHEPEDVVYLVDYKRSGMHENEKIVSHHQMRIRFDPELGLRTALKVLQLYSHAKHVYTSRLHCYLPCMAMGVPVTFGTGDNKDPDVWGTGLERFDGLKNLNNDYDAFNKIRYGFQSTLDKITSLVSN